MSWSGWRCKGCGHGGGETGRWVRRGSGIWAECGGMIQGERRWYGSRRLSWCSLFFRELARRGDEKDCMGVAGTLDRDNNAMFYRKF